MRSYPRRLPSRRREPPSCGNQLARLGLGLLVIVVLYVVLMRPHLSATLGRYLADLLVPPTRAPVATAPVPALVAALPVGEVIISEDEINRYLVGIETILPVEEASVQLVADRVIITVRAYGVTSIASSGLAVHEGQIVALDPQIEGILATLIAASDLVAELNDRINAELSRQGRQIVTARIEDGLLTIVTR
ncbi:MAG: hypothetical protein K6356_10360 [Chloroflexus sp.]